MRSLPFIFSDEWKWKWRRHAAWWSSWWLFQSILYSFSAFALQLPYWAMFPNAAIESLFYLVPHCFLAYSLMYWVIPRFWMRGSYLPGFFAVIGCFLVTAAISACISIFWLPIPRAWLTGSIFVPPPHYSEVSFFIALLAGLRGAITVGGLAAAVKLTKHWYVKEQRNLQLQNENIAAELQLLRAQVHPHFLFNTLNNIYSHTQDSSPTASRMVLGLSGLLRFMLYEGSKAAVPLGRELEIVREYIALEQIRYHEALDITLDLPQETEGLVIAPLLLLPLVENSFKHGASQRLEHPWISLSIRLEGSRMKMKLVNGKADEGAEKKVGGIGLANVRKRLELLYPGRYELRIVEDEDVFVVNLVLDLEGKPVAKKPVLLEHE